MADILENLKKKGVIKRVLYVGEKGLPTFPNGSKATFHYRTTKCDEEKTLLDDSRTHQPMELLMGKQFKLGVWETCLKSMKVKEVAEFTVDQNLVDAYPIVAKSLRDMNKKHDHDHDHSETKNHHCCGMMSMAEQGLGYPDLDDLIAHPQPLTFTIELLKLESDFDKEAWEMSDSEKLQAIPQLKEEGNELYRNKKYDDAADKYAKAIGIIEQLLLREKPGDEPWVELNQKKMPLLLNFSQCKLCLNDFYPVIEHTSTVLQHEPDNVKALFRRGKAHIGAWNPAEAKEDLTRVMELDSSLSSAVKKELAHLDQLQRQKNAEDSAKLRGKLF